MEIEMTYLPKTTIFKNKNSFQNYIKNKFILYL